MVMVNYCPVCKREYTQKSRHQTGLCPVCVSMRVRIPDDALETVHRKNIRKKE